MVRLTFAVSLAMLIVVGLVACSSQSAFTPSSSLEKFQSYDHMVSFVKKGIAQFNKSSASRGTWGILSMEGSPAALDGQAGSNYSTTNIQVAGVDELDTVKTDGESIYTVTGQSVAIVKVHPPEVSEVMARLTFDDVPVGLYINQDRLVVVHGGGMWGGAWGGDLRIMPESYAKWDSYSPFTNVSVYDVSNPRVPQLTREISLDGAFIGSRMAGDHVYLIVAKYASEMDGEIALPGLDFGNGLEEIPASDIYYSSCPDYSYQFTTIASLNVLDDGAAPGHETMLIGSSSTVYVSTQNIYLAMSFWGNSNTSTVIHRVKYDDGDLLCEASGEAPGMLLNQFSMDEYDGYLRVATTQRGVGVENSTSNCLYTLDMDLDVAGKLEGLAPGESVFSARFMGERCYLVTFRQVDPFFVIDLADPLKPAVLGELKITGFSSYLHPYDQDHIIGIGKETVAAEEGDWSWHQGVKISLFDVTDVTAPREIAKYEIGGRGSDSPVLHDHKAFLFDRERGLLVLPVSVTESNESDPWYRQYAWQGACVFDISLDEGISLRGRITHMGAPVPYEYEADKSVQRSLFIGDVLYTVSPSKIMMHDLVTLAELGSLDLTK